MLVSIIMLAYNDAPFVVRTLESIKAQTYREIEVIISDDHSSDNTVEVCQNWINQNRERFVNVKLLTTEVNTGVTANCIRATRAASGDWLKGIGCDNLMVPKCIETFVNYVNNHPAAELVQCRLSLIDSNDNIIGNRMKGPDDVFHNDRTSAEQQYAIFLRKDPVDALGMFKKRELLNNEECYDTEFRNQEDTPFAFRVLAGGHKIMWIDKPLVQRRMREGSLSGLSDGTIVSKNSLVRIDIDCKYIYPNVSGFERVLLLYKGLLIKSTFRFFNRKNKVNLFIWRFMNMPLTIFNNYKLKQVKHQIVQSWE